MIGLDGRVLMCSDTFLSSRLDFSALVGQSVSERPVPKQKRKKEKEISDPFRMGSSDMHGHLCCTNHMRHISETKPRPFGGLKPKAVMQGAHGTPCIHPTTAFPLSRQYGGVAPLTLLD